jgi:hypothetical protein
VPEVKRMHEFNTRKLDKFFNGKNFLLLEKRGRMGSIGHITYSTNSMFLFYYQFLQIRFVSTSINYNSI